MKCKIDRSSGKTQEVKKQW